MRFNCLKTMEPLQGSSLLFTTKFPEIPEYNLRNIFLERSYTKYGGETIPRPFSKKSKLSISHFVFSVCQVEDYRN